jgi:hypothetical protein
MYTLISVCEELIVDTSEDIFRSLRPYLFKDLVRLGGFQDGGYVVPEAYLHGISVFINFGVGENFDFEFHLNSKYQPKRIYSFDHLISLRYFLFFALKGLVKLFLMKMQFSQCFDRFSILVKYFYFYLLKSRVKLFKIKINQFNVEDILQGCPLNSGLKVDIEGDEYQLLNTIIDFRSKFNFIIIEFHSVELNKTSIIEFNKKIGDRFVVAHLSLNNRISDIDVVPQTMEVTYVRADSQTLDHVGELPNFKVDWHFPNRPIYILKYS